MARKGSSKITIATNEVDAPTTVVATAAARPKALVFISHDSRDADLAEAFSNLLLDVSGGTLKSFRSSDKKGNTGIEFGAEWYTAIMSQLAEATDVVALLTSQSVDRPWILYEAGVAKGRLETTVFGVAIGVPLEKVSTGPFGQFQNCGGDDDSLTKLVVQLMQKIPDADPREEAVRMQVKMFRKKVDDALALRGKGLAAKPATDEQNIAKLFEEVKAMVRELPERVDSRMEAATRRGSNRRFRRYNPRMMEELIFNLGMDDGGDVLGLRMLLSMIRDDYPWLYESGLEFERAIQSGSPLKIQKSLRQMHRVIELTTHGPMRDAMPDDKESFYMLDHLHHVIERAADRASEIKQRRTSTNPKVGTRKQA